MSYVINKGNFILIPTNKEYSNYYISGTGYLCCEIPWTHRKRCISENPLIDWGVTDTKQIEGVIEGNGEYFVKISVEGDLCKSSEFSHSMHSIS